MNYQWYPGHMMKAKRMMQEDIRLIDLVIEIIDARVPLSSRNPDIDELGKNKARLIVLNKADLADERQNDAWAAFFQEKGYFTAKVNARSGAGMKKIQETIQEACKEKIERDRRRGLCLCETHEQGVNIILDSAFLQQTSKLVCSVYQSFILQISTDNDARRIKIVVQCFTLS